MSDPVDVKGIDKAELLAALYNASQPLGLGFTQANAANMTREQAEAVIARQGLSYDYLDGRVMKINLEGDEINPWGYDRDNGEGKTAEIVQQIREGAVQAPDNRERFTEALDELIGEGPKEDTLERDGAAPTATLGMPASAIDHMKKIRGRFSREEEELDNPTIREVIENSLLDNFALLPEEIEEVFAAYNQTDAGKDIASKWDDRVEDFPPSYLSFIWTGVKEAAKEWLSENEPGNDEFFGVVIISLEPGGNEPQP